MIPDEIIAEMATLGLTPEQARAVTRMLRAVENATNTAIDGRRAKDRERQARHRRAMSRDSVSPIALVPTT